MSHCWRRELQTGKGRKEEMNLGVLDGDQRCGCVLMVFNIQIDAETSLELNVNLHESVFKQIEPLSWLGCCGKMSQTRRLNQQACTSQFQRGGSPRARCGRPTPGEGTLPGLQTATFSLYPHLTGSREKRSPFLLLRALIPS